ncbi:MAG: osmoprotectant transport system ATP-binding protein [Clostridiales bacterium]|jgi:osmoprotectant transport system ATP-binding protein|nr:osmoprotectant transport system ATP-binding protein [Clostridiales bacterium]MDN5298123.1 osmoprotectant transport system ATP-binding protein [Clostridiales bacterium]
MVYFENVEKRYPDGTLAVDGLNLEIQSGEFVVLIGPSGCGKTTSLKMINRLEECTGGKIYVNGKDIMTLNPVKLRRQIGYVIQERGLMPHHTVAENIATVPLLLGWPKKKIDARVDELLDMAGLPKEKYKYRLPAQMSGGQQQRIGVLRALASDPEVVLMDEPFGALDPISRDNLQNELLTIHKKLKKTIIFVTHDISEALKLADRIVLMRRGKIEQIGTPEELLNNPATKFVEEFIGSDQLSQISGEASVTALLEDVIMEVNLKAAISDVLEDMQDRDVKSAQVTDAKGKWHGSVYLSTLKKAQREGKKLVKETLSVNRKLYVEDGNLKDAAEMLVDMEAPIPIINSDNELQGIVTEKGMAKYTINKLIK